ncbi:MAG: TraR/DksA C4-type zinc finger protein [Mesorhizobium sp.]|nr:TraR/DksA C4-type zinc finger protein [Mesorhizobium sp.]
MIFDSATFRDKLVARREELIVEDRESAEGRAPVTLEQDSVGRLSRIDAMQVQAMALAQARRRQSERAAIDAALRRLDDDEYGYCFKCGEDIAPARLEHNPSATTCIVCAREG